MKHLKYLFFVIRHRWYVFVECCKLGIIWRGITHDLSKFRLSEWCAYADFFYGRELKGYFDSITIQRREKSLEFAWLDHIHRNPHHWQHWRCQNDDGTRMVLPMPTKYIKEMLADWRAMSRVRGFDSVREWYGKHYHKIEMAAETRMKLHQLMTQDEIPQMGALQTTEIESFLDAALMPDGKITLRKREASQITEEIIQDTLPPGSPGTEKDSDEQ